MNGSTLENFGRLSIVEWVPDSFGYANQLPQIFIKSGTPYFMSTKLCGNSYSTFPFVNFMWESPDGSQVLAYQNPGGLGPLSRHLKFDPLRRLLKAGTSLRVNYSVDKPESMDVYSDEIPPVACFTGKGDGGHGPTGEELAAIDVLVAEKGARWITPSEYFTTKLAKHEDRLPVWNDELYYEYHRGTPTTHALVKRMNRYFECRLCVIEALASTATLFKDLDQDIWSEDLEIAWKFTCLNQFHDVLPGSSIPEVYDDVYEFWEMTKAVLDQVELEAWNAVLGGADAEKGDLFYAFNGTGFDVEHVLLELPLDSCAWVPSSIRVDGKDTPVQVVEADTFGLDEHFVSRPRRVITTASIKQHAFSKMQLSKVSPPDDNASKAMDAGESLVLDNSLYSVRVSKVSGNITSIFDKSLGKEVLVAPGIQLEAYYDWHVTEQAWNIGPGYQQMPIEVRHPSRVEITEKGPVRWTVEIERTVHNPDSESDANAPSAFLQRVSLFAGSPGIHVEFLVDCHSCEAITKLNVHTATGATEIVSETPYGTIHRLINPVANHDVPRWENTHQTWFDVPAPDGSWGIAVINNGKYGHDAKDGRAGLTLLRGPLYPTASGESWVHQERKERADAGLGKVPTHADLGKHLIRLALVPHTGTWDASRPFIPALAHWFNDGGSISCAKPHADDEFVTFEVARVDDRAAEITAIKPAEDGVGCVLRVVEVAGKSGLVTVKINPYLAISSVVDADLLERPLDVQELSTVLDPNDTII